MADPIVLELVKGVPTAVVASIAVVIAWRQYLAARAKVKLDLYDRRYAIFEAAWKHLSNISSNSLEDREWLFSPFDNLRAPAAFLFGSKVESYLDRIREKRVELHQVKRRIKMNGHIPLPEDAAIQADLEAWFLQEAATGVKSVFSPWLGLEAWK